MIGAHNPTIIIIHQPNAILNHVGISTIKIEPTTITQRIKILCLCEVCPKCSDGKSNLCSHYSNAWWFIGLVCIPWMIYRWNLRRIKTLFRLLNKRKRELLVNHFDTDINKILWIIATISVYMRWENFPLSNCNTLFLRNSIEKNGTWNFPVLYLVEWFGKK